MLISHAHRFIYLKTVKTAGTSVEIYFERFCVDPSVPFDERHEHDAVLSPFGVVGYRGPDAEGQTWFNHMPATRVRELVGPGVWNRYFKFCAVRNPFDKVVSWFWFQLAEETRRTLAVAPFEEVKAAFARWLEGAHLPSDREIFSLDGEPAVDAFVRYESLAEDLAAVCKAVGVPWDPTALGNYKSDYRLRPEPFSDYYDGLSCERVRQTYAWEVEQFGYGPDGAVAVQISAT
ncbi:MAG: hypothetical protein QOH95_1580 [Gaiellaceae bacterium]|nr:hypothetical protein [Gaiellaceae bacterium]